MLSSVERTSGKCHFRFNKFNIHLTRCLAQRGDDCAKGKTPEYHDINKKIHKRYGSVFESAHKVLNFYGIEVCPNISAFENKDLKMKMWNISVPCHAHFGYLLAGANVLTYFNF
jgi:hypothetical protein